MFFGDGDVTKKTTTKLSKEQHKNKNSKIRHVFVDKKSQDLNQKFFKKRKPGAFFQV